MYSPHQITYNGLSRQQIICSLQTAADMCHSSYRTIRPTFPVLNRHHALISMLPDPRINNKPIICHLCKEPYYLFCTYRFANEKASIDFDGYTIHRILSHVPCGKPIPEELENKETLEKLAAIFKQFFEIKPAQ